MIEPPRLLMVRVLVGQISQTLPDLRRSGGRSRCSSRDALQQVAIDKPVFSHDNPHYGFHSDAIRADAPVHHAPAALRALASAVRPAYRRCSSRDSCERPGQPGHRLGCSSESVRSQDSRSRSRYSPFFRLPRGRGKRHRAGRAFPLDTTLCRRIVPNRDRRGDHMDE